MKYTVFTAVLTLATLVAGSPITVSTHQASTDSDDGSVEKRTSGMSRLYACTDDNFKGHCEHLSSPYDQCNDFSAALAHQISSIGPDKGSSCNLYPSKGCTGPTMIGGVSNLINAQYPGYPKLKAIGLDNLFVSYKCLGVGYSQTEIHK